MGAGVVTWYGVVGIILVKLSNHNTLEQTPYGVIKGILDKCGVFAYIQTIKNEVGYNEKEKVKC